MSKVWFIPDAGSSIGAGTTTAHSKGASKDARPSFTTKNTKDTK